MKAIACKAAGFLLLFTLVCGVVYTGVITAGAQVLFPAQANGSLMEANGTLYGSALVGQSFQGKTHLWGRPVTLDVSTYQAADGTPLAYAMPSNLSPASADYAVLIAQRVEALRAAHPTQGDAPVPVELVTESGSGLDPHISPAAAAYQVDRLAQANGLSADEVEDIIARCTTGRFLGLLGEETVNVLEVNLLLDGILQ